MKYLLTTLLAVGVLSAISLSTQAANSPVFHSPSQGNNYIAFDLLKTPVNAKAYCLSRGGHLAVVNTHSEASELMTQIALLLPQGYIVGDVDHYYIIGESVPANATTPITVTGQAYYQDSAYIYDGYNDAPTTTERYLEVSSWYLGFKFDDLATHPRRFICEFEDAPI